jgi:hypothetical protein
MSKLALFVAFFVSVNVFGQPFNTSATAFSALDVANYCLAGEVEITNLLYQGLQKGELTVYADNKLQKPLTLAQFDELTRKTNPNYLVSDGDEFCTFSPSTVNEPFCPGCTYGFIFDNGDVIAYWLWADVKVYLSYKALCKLLPQRCVAQLNFYKAMGLKNTQDSALDNLSSTRFKKWTTSWYNWGITGELKPYKNDSLASFYSTAQIKERTAYQQVVQIPNPANPADKYDMMDSFYYRNFTVDSVKRILVYYSWQNNGFALQGSLVALAPMFRPHVAGLTLPYYPIFLLKAGDILPKLNPDEAPFLQGFLQWIIQQRASEPMHRYFMLGDDHDE